MSMLQSNSKNIFTYLIKTSGKNFIVIIPDLESHKPKIRKKRTWEIKSLCCKILSSKWNCLVCIRIFNYLCTKNCKSMKLNKRSNKGS